MSDTTKKVRTLSDGTKVIQTEHPFVGLPDADERLAKVKIASEINRLLKKKGLKQKEAAKLLGITQPEISNLNRGRLSGFTFDRLYRCLNALNVDVEITIKNHSARSKGPAGVHILPV
ncbi:MAG: helix-turn-helix transcriptional regulator [Nitrospiria bacterium]